METVKLSDFKIIKELNNQGISKEYKVKKHNDQVDYCLVEVEINKLNEFDYFLFLFILLCFSDFISNFLLFIK